MSNSGNTCSCDIISKLLVFGERVYVPWHDAMHHYCKAMSNNIVGLLNVNACVKGPLGL